MLDFAFAIHTDIGLRFKSAIVNGEIKPISFIPQTGDVIHINTFKSRYSANRHRLDFLHTASAKVTLSKFLRTQQKDEILKQVTSEFAEYLKSFQLPSLGSQADKIMKKYTKEAMEKKLFSVYDKKETFSSIVRDFYPEERRASHKNIRPVKLSALAKMERDAQVVIVDGDELINYYFCPECKPAFGEKIIAKTGRAGIKIHSMECKSMKTVAFDKLLEAHRKGQEENQYQVDLEFKLSTKYGNIMNIVKLFSELHISVLQVSLRNLPDDTSLVTLESEFSNPAKIAFLLNSLKKFDDSVQIVKKKII